MIDTLCFPPFKARDFLHTGNKDEASSLKDQLHPGEIKGKCNMVSISSFFGVNVTKCIYFEIKKMFDPRRYG